MARVESIDCVIELLGVTFEIGDRIAAVGGTMATRGAWMLLVAAALSACSADTTPGSTAAKTTTTSTTTKPTTYYGQTASVVATMIKGCTNVQVSDAGDGAKGGLSSSATCLLNGRSVDVNTWASAEAEDGVQAVISADKVEAYYAKGAGWTVTTHDDGTLQMQLTNDAGGLLAQEFNSPEGATPTAADVPGQKQVAEAAIASLGGEIVHVVP